MAKKMLVTDYDGTLKSDLKNLKLNIDAIKKFRADGNIFTISTGRSYESIKKECNKYGIDYDFLNCNDGSVLFDSNDNLIFANTFFRDNIVAIATTLKYEYGIQDVTMYGTHGVVDIPRHLIGRNDADPIVEVHLRLKMLHDIKAYIGAFKDTFPEIKFYKFGRDVFIKEKFSKKDGINVLEDYLDGEIKKEDIIAVGDNHNDLELLQEYNGYKMLTSYPCLYRKNLKTTREVHTLVKKLTK